MFREMSGDIPGKLAGLQTSVVFATFLHVQKTPGDPIPSPTGESSEDKQTPSWRNKVQDTLCVIKGIPIDQVIDPSRC